MQWYRKGTDKAEKVAQAADLTKYKEGWEAYAPEGMPFDKWMQANYPEVPIGMGQPAPMAAPAQVPVPKAAPGVKLIHEPAKNMERVKTPPSHMQDINDSLKKMPPRKP